LVYYNQVGREDRDVGSEPPLKVFSFQQLFASERRLLDFLNRRVSNAEYGHFWVGCTRNAGLSRQPKMLQSSVLEFVKECLVDFVARHRFDAQLKSLEHLDQLFSVNEFD